jgi:hypothetical protein
MGIARLLSTVGLPLLYSSMFSIGSFFKATDLSAISLYCIEPRINLQTTTNLGIRAWWLDLVITAALGVMAIVFTVGARHIERKAVCTWERWMESFGDLKLLGLINILMKFDD